VFKKKVIDIPIYMEQLTMIIVDGDFEELGDKYGIPEKQYDAGALTWTEDDFESFVAFRRDHVTHSAVSHEALHVIQFLYSNRGIEYVEGANEHDTYLLGWLVKQITRFCAIELFVNDLPQLLDIYKKPSKRKQKDIEWLESKGYDSVALIIKNTNLNERKVIRTNKG